MARTNLAAALCLLAIAVQYVAAAPAPLISAKLKPYGTAANDTSIRSSGTVELWENESGDLLYGTVTLKQIVNFTHANVQIGLANETGPIFLWAYPLDPAFLGSTPYLSGNFRFPFTFPSAYLDPNTLSEEGYYFNVHTVEYPQGEIRGQMIGEVRPVPSPPPPSPVYPPAVYPPSPVYPPSVYPPSPAYGGESSPPAYGGDASPPRRMGRKF